MSRGDIHLSPYIPTSTFYPESSRLPFTTHKTTLQPLTTCRLKTQTTQILPHRTFHNSRSTERRGSRNPPAPTVPTDPIKRSRRRQRVRQRIRQQVRQQLYHTKGSTDELRTDDTNTGGTFIDLDENGIPWCTEYTKSRDGTTAAGESSALSYAMVLKTFNQSFPR